jgi:hypothetical protein
MIGGIPQGLKLSACKHATVICATNNTLFCFEGVIFCEKIRLAWPTFWIEVCTFNKSLNLAGE